MLVWDDARQRYFSRPPTGPSATTAPPAPRAPTSPFPALARLRTLTATARKDALVDAVHLSQIALTATVERTTIPTDGHLSAFRSVSYNGRVWSFAGDTLGWVCSHSHDPLLGWQPQFFLSSEVSSISVSATTCVATTFGPDCRILYAPLDLPVEGIHRIDNRVVHDIWTADLLGPRLVLGANKQAVMIDDIAICTSLQRLPTQSDVFALAQSENLIYAGLRNGTILRFDTRLPSSNGHPLHSSSTSITALKHLRDHQLLASFIDGGISTFDLRFPLRAPLLTFTGNFNQYTVKLPLATDPYEKFLFAAGQDKRIRLWSLNTGGVALGTTLFHQPFDHPIAALQVVEETEGMYLLAASGSDLYKYTLGHRG